MSRLRLIGYLVAAVVVAAILTTGAVLTFTPKNTTTPSPGPTTSSAAGTGPASTPASSGPASSAGPAGCVSTPTASGGPITAAPATQWYIVPDTGQPAPKTAGGPFKMEDGLGLCYTPDTLGALTAAANMLLRTFTPSAAKMYGRQHVPALTKEELEQIAKSDTGITKPYPTLLAFSSPGVISNNEVTVNLQLTGTAKGTPFTLWASVRMRWTGTDWAHVEDSITVTPATVIEWQA